MKYESNNDKFNSILDIERMIFLSKILNNLEPQSVFSFFEELSQIPRCSGDEKRISDYLVKFAQERKLEVIQDETLNVIIKKPGTTGYENAPTVILQGHMDMVCEKNKGTKHDFTCEPIKLRIQDDMIYATGTTLGADNGIAIAYSLALLDSNDIPHPPLEVLVTTGEETGMEGAIKLDGNNFKGKILLNMDAEDEGVFFVSCAGGLRNRVSIPVKREKVNNDLQTVTLKIRGLKGGHSGIDINKQRGNSNKLMGRILNSLNRESDIRLVEVSGGSKMNAIPREADAKILITSEFNEDLKKIIEQWNGIFKNELKSSDPDITVEFEHIDETVEEAFTNESTDKVIQAIMLIPNGVQTMSLEIESLVQSSTNIGVVTTTEKNVMLESAIRSSVKSLKYDVTDRIDAMAKALDGISENGAEYPEWEYNPNSHIREIFKKVYTDKYGKEPEITAIHAGLECGLLSERLGKDVDMIAFGPDMYDVHTPEEHLNIPSTARTWDFICAVLKEIK